MADESLASTGRRRPKPDDLPKVIELVEETSLRKACAHLGLHPGQTHAALKADPDRWGEYIAAIELRGQDFVEQGLGIAAQVIKGKMKPEAARVAADILKWANGQMAPKTVRHEHAGPNGGAIPHEVRSMTKEDLEAEIAALTHASTGASDDADGGEG